LPDRDYVPQSNEKGISGEVDERKSKYRYERMTKAERIHHSEKHGRRVKLFERKYLRQVFDAIHSQILSFTKILKAQGIDEARRHLDTVILNDQIAPVILRLYTEVGLYQANKVLREINASAKESHKQLVLVYKVGVSTPDLPFQTKGFGDNEEWINAIINYFKGNLLSKTIIPITETTKKQILDVLTQAQAEGWGIDKIAHELESSEISLWRAQLITRTELAKAYFKGHQLGEEKSKWESVSEWVTAHDHRVRSSHNEVDGEKIGTGGRFKVPIYKTIGGGKGKKGIQMLVGYDLMEGPGDPKASIGNIANCRCIKITRAKRDEGGRLIPKIQRLQIQ
jgi:hypothetical protein